MQIVITNGQQGSNSMSVTVINPRTDIVVIPGQNTDIPV